MISAGAHELGLGCSLASGHRPLKFRIKVLDNRRLAARNMIENLAESIPRSGWAELAKSPRRRRRAHHRI